MVNETSTLTPVPGDRFANLPVADLTCRVYRVRVLDRSRIGYVNATIEGYDWVARVYTVEQRSGILQMVVPTAWNEVFQTLIRELAKEEPMEFLSGW